MKKETGKKQERKRCTIETPDCTGWGERGRDTCNACEYWEPSYKMGGPS